MNSDLVRILSGSLLATFNPSLLAAVTVMLLLPHPTRLMEGYLLGTYATSLTFGLVIVFSLHGSSVVHTSKRTASPSVDILAGVAAVAIAFVLATRLDARIRSWRGRRKQAKAKAGDPSQPWQLRMLGRGSARVTFVVGAVLSFPGVSYLTALDRIARLNPGTTPTVALVVYFCVMQQILLELPLLCYVFAPERTQDAVTAFRAWLDRWGRRVAVIGALAIGIFLLSRGVTALC